MRTNKILLAGLAGGVVYFLLGWLIYGMVLASFMDGQSTPEGMAVMRPDDGMVFWAMIVGNIAGGMLLAVIFGRWANISTWQTGAMAGAVIAGLMAMSFDFLLYGTTTMMTLTGVLADIVVYAVLGAIGGAVVAMVLGSGKK
ncbi:MAG: hypothetical protein KBG02_03705 [Haliscomenobacter sp.]|nr:hypothetical protein [Haliscomenobacter sp.]MBK8654189.1 hypothetical protein [Haliscomenobacter sp.]MBP9075940.1 hypothetical protein [Haliscomenobacter sp.]MBP9875019.1 hypothetical protein [Haliscomenobacter sp.]